MRFSRILAISITMGLLGLSGSVLAQNLPPPLPLTNILEVAKTEWLLGEPVEFIQTRCNESETELVLKLPTQCPVEAANVRIWDVNYEIVAFRFPPGPPPFCAPETWQPGECRTSSLVWPQTFGDFFGSAQGSQVEPGIYRADFSNGTDSIVEFSILPAPRTVPTLTSWTLALLVFLIAVFAGVRLAMPPDR